MSRSALLARSSVSGSSTCRGPKPHLCASAIRACGTRDSPIPEAEAGAPVLHRLASDPFEDQQVFFRAEAPGYPGLRHTALEYPGARDLARCWGLDSIRRAGLGSGSADNATGWVARDTNIHIETTVQQVERFLQRHNRLSEVILAPVRLEPWQQETWIETFDQDR